jgi:hypothetical protein
VIVNKANPVAGISLHELRAILPRRSGGLAARRAHAGAARAGDPSAPLRCG